MINRYTVIGQPIAHSLSPIIHQFFGELTQRRIQYTRTEGTAETFERIVLDWQTSGGRGCNVTLPFKEMAASVCDRLSENAARSGAVNTIHMHRDGNRVGHNTDGVGLIADLNTQMASGIQSKRVLLIGAGGAARGVVGPLLDAHPSALHIVNRTAERADALACLFDNLGQVSASGYEALIDIEAFDVIINATSLSLQGQLPPLPDSSIAAGAFAYDMMYGTGDTVFMSWARRQGCEVSNGFGMLLEQAAEAFLIWEGVRPKMRIAAPRLKALLR